jgi:hypothetical protein
MSTPPLPRKSSRVSVSLDLPLIYYDWIKEQLKRRSLNEIWIELIDLYLVREADQVRRLRFQILKRVKQGIDAEYLDQLKLLHDVLGQILTRCGVTLYD